jgi:lipid A 4'-phosphatase
MTPQLPSPLRSYLKLRRTRTILGCFVASSALLVAFAGIDLGISRLFFERGFYMANQAWTRLLHESVTWFIVISAVLVCGVYGFNRLAKRMLWGIDGRKVAYLFLVLALGCGLVVNGILKDGFGRARPRDIAEFGGTAQFTPAYVISSACGRNCSFSSGDSAGAFLSLACVMAFGRKRALTTAAVGFGVLVSAARIASGAHFLSDTVVSYFVMLIVSDALYYRMFLFDPGPARIPAAPQLPPGAAALVSAVEGPSRPL